MLKEEIKRMIIKYGIIFNLALAACLIFYNHIETTTLNDNLQRWFELTGEVRNTDAIGRYEISKTFTITSFLILNFCIHLIKEVALKIVDKIES